MGQSESKSSRTETTIGSSLRQKLVLQQGYYKTLCDAAPPSPPPLPPTAPESSSPPPPPPSSSPQDDSIAKAAAEVSDIINPGPYEMAATEGKRFITLDTYDGLRFDINKQISPFMVAVHSFWLGTNMIPDGRKSTYSFVAQVADERRLLMARVDPGRGSVDGRIHYALPIGMFKTQMSASQDGQSDQLLAEIDTAGTTWSGNLKYGSMGGGMVFGCNYFQAITKGLAMGGEGMYLSANKTLMSNYTLKYTMPAKTGDEDTPTPAARPAGPPGSPPLETAGSSTLCLNFNTMQGALTANYKRVITPNRVTLATELQCNPLTLQSELLVGAEFQLQKSKMNFCFDANTLKIQSLLETKLGSGPQSPSLTLSADVDHVNDDMKFGYGLNINA